MSKVVRLNNRDWWKVEREPATAIIIQKKRTLAPKYYSLHDLCVRLNSGYDRLYKAVRKGELEAIVVGASYRVSDEAVERWIDLCRKKKRLG